MKRQEAIRHLGKHYRQGNFWDDSALKILKNEAVALDEDQVASLCQAVNGAKQKRCTIIHQLLPKEDISEDDDGLITGPSVRTPLENAQAKLDSVNKDRIQRLEKFLDLVSCYCELVEGLSVRVRAAPDQVAEQLINAVKKQDSGCGDIAEKLLDFVCYSDESEPHSEQYSLEELAFLRLLGLLALNLKRKHNNNLDLWDRGALLVLRKPDFQLNINLNPEEMNNLIDIDSDYSNSNSPVRKALIRKELTGMCGSLQSCFYNRSEILTDSTALLAEMCETEPELVNGDCRETADFEEKHEQNGNALVLGMIGGSVGTAAVLFLTVPVCVALVAMTPGMWPITLYVGLMVLACIGLTVAFGVTVSTFTSCLDWIPPQSEASDSPFLSHFSRFL